MPRPLRPPRAKRLSTKAPLWQCPLCGARFVTRNMSHSCGRYRLADLFRGKPRAVRTAYDRLRVLIQACGPVEIIPQKTRIVFTTRMRFAAVMPRSAWLEGHLNLARRVDDPRFFKIVQYGPATYTHSYRARDAAFFDASFAALVEESYIRGCQAHERPSAARRPA